MPRLNHQVQVQEVVSYETEMVLRLVLDQLNVLREQVHLPPIQESHVRHAVKQYLHTHPRGRSRG
jgi:hypothetical protein